MNSEIKEILSKREERLALKNIWVWCSDCGAKLFESSGTKDFSMPCLNNCKEENEPRD